MNIRQSHARSEDHVILVIVSTVLIGACRPHRTQTTEKIVDDNKIMRDLVVLGFLRDP
jgi:hypothetical protein